MCEFALGAVRPKFITAGVQSVAPVAIAFGFSISPVLQCLLRAVTRGSRIFAPQSTFISQSFFVQTIFNPERSFSQVLTVQNADVKGAF